MVVANFSCSTLNRVIWCASMVLGDIVEYNELLVARCSAASCRGIRDSPRSEFSRGS